MAYIKRVIIKGFKTYRNETIIDNFSPHQNVIIGSNGSGKSNFFAAIRFVLSDDYSNLKREERQGLIHQGSGGSVMSASVEIVFHDPDHSMILPSGVLSRGDDEVTIRRTVGLKKDDYQLNDRNVTKGDIVRMLETAGFSMNNPYNIVPQGKIVALTNAKDKERLQLLEDVVGAKSFEVKLKASLKKMEETEQKKIQINKEMGELNSKLSEMEQERKELEKYNELERNRKIYQFTLYDRELNEVINQMERLDGDYNNTVYSSESSKHPTSLVPRGSDITSDQLLQRLNDMNTEISGLKNVNKRAFENFKKFNERRKDLAERASELDESKDSIQDLIVKLKQQKVNAVDSTFQKVSENFEAVFERLVPRGTAKLIIHRKNDNANDHDESIDVDMDAESNESQNGKDSEIMYTGVSISVSFNSKQNEQLHVEQLSGGQKTVCAIALILAIQMVDPASFYLFDEIDACLDKQYRTAVATLLKELSKNAQFICTTFRTDMLQVADKFFRVKYECKISTVIEVNREEAIGFIRGSNKFAEV
uniref:Structural maintenance of chromosomes protein 3,Structural maintenance of chromosomes protein 3 n=1 Tax=Saccharomyces cerevisiae (strain ATCC 204508 / S288c) TaxID=559292 RepID=UPI0013893A53|nr:Chain C, Structural maintenance of chromosomes protein 3,Structural maintenance of chromosomes protein 3 [Saccharomyces cerevisiae S288C]